MSELIRPRIAVLASGNGSTAEALIHATQDGRADFEVGLVICNRPPEEAKVWERIDRLNKLYGLDIEIKEINDKTHPSGNVKSGQTLGESNAICKVIEQGHFAHVALLGYMKIVTGALMHKYGWNPRYTSKYQARMSNTHPGPLPETAGTYKIHASERVLELGLPQTKLTVHIASEKVDAGPIIAEHPIDVLPGDTAQALFERVQAVEKAVLAYAIDRFLKEQRQYNNLKI